MFSNLVKKENCARQVTLSMHGRRGVQPNELEEDLTGIPTCSKYAGGAKWYLLHNRTKPQERRASIMRGIKEGSR